MSTGPNKSNHVIHFLAFLSSMGTSFLKEAPLYVVAEMPTWLPAIPNIYPVLYKLHLQFTPHSGLGKSYPGTAFGPEPTLPHLAGPLGQGTTTF